MNCRTLLALSVVGLLVASGCSTPRPIPPTPSMPENSPPTECLTSCPPAPPPPADERGEMSEAEAVGWIHEVLHEYGACRRQHEACRTGKAR